MHIISRQAQKCFRDVQNAIKLTNKINKYGGTVLIRHTVTCDLFRPNALRRAIISVSSRQTEANRSSANENKIK